jgi:xanthine/uracil/vitamin C permease (AzgA family)
MKVILTLLLVLIAIVMIYISLNSGIPAPGLTGLGFLIVAALFYLNTKK